MNDPISLLKELLKHHSSNSNSSLYLTHNSPVDNSKVTTVESSFKHKLNCYSTKNSNREVENDSDNELFNNINVKIESNKIKEINKLDYDKNIKNTKKTCSTPSKSTEQNNSLNSEIPVELDIANQDVRIQQCDEFKTLILMESAVKRKCIIKSFRKPKFNKWKSYWLQLIGGNLLIYYPAKTIVFNTIQKNANSNKVVAHVAISNLSSISEVEKDECTSNSKSTISSHQENGYVDLQQPTSKSIKSGYQKNPCKMHQIASWMVVNLYQDIENEILLQQTNFATSVGSNNYPRKFDIQLNDLNNGNMYKYRFDNLLLAKEWFEKFKLASNYHERLKLDNLIKFD